MPLPPRTFWTIPELAARWACASADVAAWAAEEQITLWTSIRPASAGDAPVAGLVQIPGADILALFPRDMTGPSAITLHRCRSIDGPGDWLEITAPENGIPIDRQDILVRAQEVERLEDDWQLSRRGPGGQGGREKHDWEAFYVALTKRIYEGGLPNSQSELVNEMLDWFIRRTAAGEAPDLSTIRRKIKPVWHALHED